MDVMSHTGTEAYINPAKEALKVKKKNSNAVENSLDTRADLQSHTTISGGTATELITTWLKS